MRFRGKKIGKHVVETQLARYEVEVRFDVGSNIFVLVVPSAPGAVPDRLDSSTYEQFADKDLDAAKKAAEAYLKGRDVAAFEDVIEYSVGDYFQRRESNLVVFDCRVARVSRDSEGNFKLEKEVSVGEDGAITEDVWSDAKTCPPGPYKHGFDLSVPYTVERWRKCVAVRDGLLALKKMLDEVFADESKAGQMLDCQSFCLALPALAKGEDVAAQPRVRKDIDHE